MIAERRLYRAFHRRVNIRLFVHHDAVFTPHLQHCALDPHLSRHSLPRQLADSQPHFLRSREPDVPRLRVGDQRISNRPARPGDEVHRFLRNACLKKNVDKFCRNRWRIAGRLEHHRVPGDQRRRDQSRHDGARKIPRGDDYAHAQRNIHKVVALAAHRH